MGKLVATGTGFGANQVSSLLPVFAKFADVQYLMKGTGYEESVTNLIRLAHTAQHYDPKSLGSYADLLTKASFVVPGGLGEVGHALKYSQGVAKTALGVDDEQMVLMTALMNRLGLSGSRGGTNLIAAMSRTIPGVFGSGLLTGKSGAALSDMGMIDAKGHAKVFNHGKFDFMTWMGLMSSYVQREFARNPEAIARQHIMTNFQHAYGVQGARVGTLLSNPQAIEQWKQIGETFSQYGGVEGMQKKFADESVAQQYENAKTNFISAMTELGYTLLPLATRYLKEFNGYMARLIDWMTKNPDKVKDYATNLALLAGALVGLGIVSSTTAAIMTLTTAVRALGGAAAGGGVPGWVGKAGVALPTLAAGYAFGSWIDDKVGVGKYWTDKATDWFNPKWSNYDPNAPSAVSGGKIQRSGSDHFIRPQQPKVNVSVVNKMDKHGFVTMVTDEQGKMLSRPQTGGTSFDEHMHQIPAGGF